MLTVAESLRARLHGALRLANGQVCFRVWAPLHRSVTLVLGLGAERRTMPLQAENDGYFSLTLPEIPAGTRYAYWLDDSTHDLPDPASRWQPDGVHLPSAVAFPEDYIWHDTNWRGLNPAELVIYELHIGTFTKEGTFAAVIPRLTELKNLGITALEIMPVAQFPGSRNWGYDGVHPYAVQNTYGGFVGLQQLVDAAHQTGLGVILDVVYNHFGPEGNYLPKFGPYLHDRYHTPWGATINYDGPDSDPVRLFAIQNACQWIRDFHLDGLRLDAVQTICDQGAYPLIAELQEAVQRTAADCGRTAIVIAETDQNDARITAGREEGGYGLNGVWSDDFHHCVHTLLTGERDGYYADFQDSAHQLAKCYREAFVYDGVYSRTARRRHGSRVTGQPRERFVICIQNHDQIGNRALGDRWASQVEPAAQRLAAALMLLAPDTPLLFMGEEYGETNPFPFFCSFNDRGLQEAVRKGRLKEFTEKAFRWEGELPDATVPATFGRAKLSWCWQDDPHRAGLRTLYHTLLHARRKWPPLMDRRHTSAELQSLQPDQPVLILQRGQSSSLYAIANLSRTVIPVPSIDLTGKRPILSSEQICFGGERDLTHPITELRDHELIVWGDAAWM